MRIRTLLNFFFVLVCVQAGTDANARTVQVRLDSLLAEVPKSPKDTSHVLLLCAISVDYFQSDPNKGIEYGIRALTLAKKLNYQYGIVKSNNSIGRCYAIQTDFVPALRYYQDALVAAKKMDNPVIIATLQVSLGAIYTDKDELDKALSYLLQAKETYEKAGVKDNVTLLNNIGRLYKAKEQYEKSLSYFQAAVSIEEEKGVATSMLASLYNNIGTHYIFLRGYDNALRYLFNALSIQRILKNDRSQAYILNNIGETYVQVTYDKNISISDSLSNKAKNLQNALHYLQQSIELSQRLGLKDVLLLNYDNIAKAYELIGNFKLSNTYIVKYMLLNDSLRDFTQEKEFAKVEARYLFKQKNDSLAFQHILKDELIKKNQLQRNGSIALISLSGLIIALFINRARLKQKQKGELAEAEVTYTQEKARQQLEDFTKRIHEKNDLIEKFTTEIEKYKSLPDNKQLTESNKSVDELKHSVILTEEQWQAFQVMFNNVHTGYISRIKEKFNGLTQAELRFVLLTKLGLDNKAMAGMQGVSLEAVRVSKHRLLKKLDLPEGTQLDQLLSSI